ncbi:hypothetical protein Nepgr_021774 [Nepenthes gracilis]|uniref:Uncharacterized protein n=1 Tax=Nepenthes gracilis TaxID=150966 RepID=A0AAD3XWC7_NEPGR|nr:hypothetical protein Nepgr_021774 [Nepenthes gracilis]
MDLAFPETRKPKEKLDASRKISEVFSRGLDSVASNHGLKSPDFALDTLLDGFVSVDRLLLNFNAANGDAHGPPLTQKGRAPGLRYRAPIVRLVMAVDMRCGCKLSSF